MPESSCICSGLGPTNIAGEWSGMFLRMLYAEKDVKYYDRSALILKAAMSGEYRVQRS